MKTKFTVQDVIEMGAKLYDDCNFTRQQSGQWLTILVENNMIESEVDFSELHDGVYDLICG